MKKLYVLIGVPASGKSTWAESQPFYKDCAYISSDTYLEEEAKRIGKTYSEIWQNYIGKAVDLMVRDVKTAAKEGKDIIWDQTSTTVASRKRKFRMLPDYHAIAVVFPTPEREELDRRIASRPGRPIPKRIVDEMIERLVPPTKDEGFKEIWVI